MIDKNNSNSVNNNSTRNHSNSSAVKPIPYHSNFNDPMEFDPDISSPGTDFSDFTIKQRNSIRRNKSKSFAHLPPSPATHTISQTLKLNNHLGDHKDNHNEYSAGFDTPIKSPGFIRALNSQRDDLTNHSPSHHPSPSRPKSSSSRPGTPPPKSFLSEEKRKNRSSVGSRFAAEAKQFFQGNSNYHSSTFNGRRKSTPAIKTSVSSTSVDTPTTSRDSTSFSSLRSRRNSASSEISSLNSNDDFTFAKDVDVPPVPRIPKDFSMTSSQNDQNDQDDQNSTVLLSHQPSMSSSSKFNRRKESINSLISFSRFKNDNHHRENYSPTQANCINFTPSSKRHSTVRRMTPSSIPFFRRSSSSFNINGISNDEPPPPVPSISQSHFANNSTSSNSTSFTNGTNDTTPSTPSNRKSVLGLGFPSLLKTSSSRKSLSSKPVSSENLSNNKNEGSEQSSFRARRNSLSAVIMGRRRGKTVSNVEPVPKIKPEYLHLNDVEKEKGKDNSVTPTVSPQIRSKTVKPIQQQQQQQLRSENLNSRSNTIRNITHNSTLSSVNNSLETLHPDGKRDLKLITPTRIPRISMSNLQTPQSRSPSSIMRKPSTIRKVSDSTIKSSRPSTNGSMTSLNEGVTNNNNNHNDSPKEIRKRVIDKSFESKRFSKPSMNEDKVERKNKIHEKSNSVSIVGSKSFGINSTPKSTYSKINSNSNNSSNTSTIPTSISSSSISSNKTQQPVRAKSILNSRSSTNFTNSSTISKNRLMNDGKNQDVIAADDEMMAYIRRSQARKLASGASLRELDSMLAFPEPVQPTPRMSPREAIALFGSSLSPYELHEILGYRDIYFVGPSARKRPATKERSSSNHGYDDERGDYLIIKHDHLNYRYEIIDTLGKGSFGQVLQCLDHKTGNSVAIKIIRNKKRFHHQALVEVKILERLIDWDPENQHNVIMKTEHFYFRGHLCISTELLSINLYELIKANSFAGFSTTLIRRFAAQMLQSLVLMKQHNVIHCDLKPENVLLRHPAKSSIKVIDFGSSCFENEKVYTYIQSRFYRSPEVILGMEYTSAIDMWSFGAILVELYTGYPIFPGENEQEQLACLMEVLGIPEKYIVDKSTRRKIFFDSTGAPRPVINSKGRRRRPNSKSISSVLKTDDDQFVDFITKCLAWDPDRRLKPLSALKHPFITGAMHPQPTSTNTIRLVKRPSTASSTLQSNHAPTTFKVPTNTATESKKSMISEPTPLGRHKPSYSTIHSGSYSSINNNTNNSNNNHNLKSPKILSSTPRILRSKISSGATNNHKSNTVTASSKY